MIKQLKVMAALQWLDIGEQSWNDEHTLSAAEIRGSEYVDWVQGQYVICQNTFSGWAIVAPFDKAYIDKLHSKKVQLHVQYKNKNKVVKFYKATVSLDKIHQLAQELVNYNFKLE